MKFIYVMADSMRRDHVSPYGSPAWGAVQTPNLERFGETAAVFEDYYIGSFPTVPNRRDTLLGHGDKGSPFNEWRPLDPDEVTLPRRLREAGVPSMWIGDTQNNVTGGLNLQRDYTAWHLNRGQEGDPCWLSDVPLELPVPPALIRYTADWWHRVLINRAHRRKETDWFAPGTYSTALRWLEENRKREHFFLWLDTFDPHEPWDPPQHYLDLYDPGYEGRVFEAPTYGQRRELGITDRELQHIRARYASEVTMVDHWFGKLLDKLDELGLADDTAVLFCADHGTNFDGPGDLGMLQKANMVGADGSCMAAGQWPGEPRRWYPISPNVARVPLLLRLPGMTAGRRVKGIVQPWDVHATVLDYFGAAPHERLLGASVLPMARGEREGGRPAAVLGQAPTVQVMDGRWLYACWRGQRPACLYDLQADPCCEHDLTASEPAALAALHEQAMAFVRSQGMEGYAAGYQR